MGKFMVGYLFEYITLDNLKGVESKELKKSLKNQEVFKIKDVVAGLKFTNTDHVDVAHIITGKYSGEMAVLLQESVSKQRYVDYKYVVLEKDFDVLLKENGYRVDVKEILNKLSEKLNYTYYRRDGEDNQKLFGIEETEEFEKCLRILIPKAFSEDAFEETSDIRSIYEDIKKTVIAQDEPIMKILTSIYKNQLAILKSTDSDFISHFKDNILVCGATGTGKTEIVRRIAKIYDVPMVIEDSTSMSETGYVGREATSMLENLYYAAGKDIKKAERGILVIDEIDKLSEKEKGQSHVSREGVQRSLLKILEGSVLFLKDNIRFDTSRLTVVSVGAFTGISDDYQDITQSKLASYGLLPDLVGRFKNIVTMNTLTKEDYRRILLESNFSPLCLYKEFLSGIDVEFEYTEGFVTWFIDKVYEQESSADSKNKTGARCINAKFEEFMSSAMFRIFAGEIAKVTMIEPNENGFCYELIKREEKPKKNKGKKK